MALEAVRDGFYLTERRESGGLRVRRKDGSWEILSEEHAVADYLRVLRNSAHSFLGKFKAERDLSLLAAHTAHISDDLPDLALLYVMDLLISPERPFRGS